MGPGTAVRWEPRVPSLRRRHQGRASDHGYVGDWNGNGTWTPEVLGAGTRWYLRNSFSGSAASLGLAKQTPGTPVVGDWTTGPDQPAWP